MIQALEPNIVGEVLDPAAPRPAIIEALTPGCGACYQAGQVLALLSEHHPAVDFYRLDIADPTLAALVQRLRITEVPTVILWSRGAERVRLSGPCGSGALADLVAQASALQSPAPCLG